MDTRYAYTTRIDIWLCGNKEVIAQACREYCYKVGLCVTVQEADFIYTGGEEKGVRIGLVNYPRLPSSHDDIWQKAYDLADILIERACQHSVLLVGDTQTVWKSRRDYKRNGD
jgi:hypothetical protein